MSSFSYSISSTFSISFYFCSRYQSISSSRSTPLPVSRSTADKWRTMRLRNNMYLSWVIFSLLLGGAGIAETTGCSGGGELWTCWWEETCWEATWPILELGSLVSISPVIATSCVSISSSEASAPAACLLFCPASASSSSISTSSCSTWMMDWRRSVYASLTNAGVIYSSG